MRTVILAMMFLSGCVSLDEISSDCSRENDNRCASFEQLTINCLPDDDKDRWLYLEPKYNDLTQYKEFEKNSNELHYWFKKSNELISCAVPLTYKWVHNLPTHKGCVTTSTQHFIIGKGGAINKIKNKGAFLVCT